jgi:hypothetical protein
MTPARRDAVWAAAAGAAALVVYVRTLAPGLVAIIDTPMFQFVGRVLGVAHPPGYPLYVLLTYPFSFLPVGSLPYRINLFSAVLAGVAVALTFLVARRLGCRTVVSLAAALGLAFGQVFWSQAVIAEVYTLHVAIVAGLLLAVLTWGHTRRPGYWFAAVGIFAVGLGNHTTIVGFAPALAAYALLTDPRFATRARTLLLSAVIVALGLLQYGWILLRTGRPGTYVESPATSAAGLLDVMLARRFQSQVFAFDWWALATERVPFVGWDILVAGLTPVGMLLAVVGLAWLLRRRPAEGALLFIGGSTIAAFALVYDVIDTPVFLLPAILVLWLAAGVGAERLTQRLRRRWLATTAVSLVLMALPAWELVRHFPVNDQSRNTGAAVEFQALFDALPSRAIFVREDFLVDRMVMFKLVGEDAAAGRQIEVLGRRSRDLLARVADGFTVLAFEKGANVLRHEGLDVDFEPRRLLNGTLQKFLADLPDGSIVALGVPGRYAARFAARTGASLSSVGGPNALPSSPAGGLAALGVRGAREGAQITTGAGNLHLAVSAGRRIGKTGKVSPSTIEIRTTDADATILQNSRVVGFTSEGVALAVWQPDGLVRHVLVLQPHEAYRVPLPAGPLSVYELRGPLALQEVGAGGGSLVTDAFGSGSAVVRVPAGSTLVLYVADDRELVPRGVGASSRGTRIDVVYFGPDATQGLHEALEADGLTSTSTDFRSGQHVYRLRVQAPADWTGSAMLALGSVPSLAIARLTGGDGTQLAAAFRVALDGLLHTPDRRSKRLVMSHGDQAHLIGAGWSDVAWDEVAPYRWVVTAEAHLLLPVDAEDVSRVRIQALLDQHTRQPVAGVPTTVALRLNSTVLPPQPLFAGWHVYEWAVPSGTLRRGVNEATLLLNRLPPPGATKGAPTGIAVADLRLLY